MIKHIISANDKTIKAVQPVISTISSAARFTVAAGFGFLLILFLLHFIKQEFDPSWHFISEYAIGKNGWLMSGAFILLAAGYISLFISIRSQITGKIGGKIALGLVLISAAGLAIAGIFTTDPIMTGNENMTPAGKLHSLGGTLGTAMPFATLLITWKLVKNPAWAPVKRPLIWSTVFALMGFLLAFISLGAMLSQSNGTFGPSVLVGWPNRIEIVGYTVWLITVGYQAKKLSTLKN